MNINNAKSWPKVYYGMHMEPGVAEYAEPNTEPYRILIVENALKAMDPTYEGKPVYVQHVDEVDLDNLQNEADGYVMQSFFNPADGKHWAKFIVVSDKGHEAVRRGWQLSNSYVPKSFSEGGEWHGVHYMKEITAGEYEHLAIVPNPRYEASVIMTPEEFKRYNEDKEVELKRLSNSKNKKGDTKMKLNIFKKAKVDNVDDLAAMSVVLPKSGREVTIEKLVNEADERAEKKKNSMAEMHDKVKLHDGMMCNVAELVDKHKALHDELEGMKAKKDDAKEGESEVEEEKEAVDVEGDDKAVDNEEDEEAKDKKENDEDESMDNDEDVAKAEEKDKEVEAAKKKKNDIQNAAEKKKAAKEKADRLRNAGPSFEGEEVATVSLSEDRVARGKSLYGSN